MNQLARLISTNTGSPGAYISEYQAILDYATAQGYTLPSVPVRVAQNALIIAMKSAGIWVMADVFYNFTNDAGINFSRINWKAPGTFTCTVVGTTAVFVPNSGIQLDGLTYLDTNWKPGTDGVKFLQDDAAVVVYITTDDPADGVYDFGCSNNADGITNGIMLNSAATIATGGVARINANATHGLTLSSGRTEGYIILRRTANNAAEARKNTSFISNSAATSVARPTTNMFIGATNGNGTPVGITSRQYGMFLAGAALPTVTSNTAFYNAWIAYVSQYRSQVAYTAILDYALVQGYTAPSVAVKTLQLALIKSLIEAGIWDFMDLFYVFAADGGIGFASINWKNPGLYDCTRVGSPTHIPNVGIRFNGTSQHLDTNWKPGINGHAYQQNEASFAIYYPVDVQTNFGEVQYDLGCSNNVDGITNSIVFDPSTDTGYIHARVNGNAFHTASGNVGGTNTVAMYQFIRTSVSGTTGYKNGSGTSGAGSVTSTVRPTTNLFIGASNGNGTPVFRTVRTISKVMTGGNTDSRQNAYYNAWNTYWTSLPAPAAPTVSDPDYQAVLDHAVSQGWLLPSEFVINAQDDLAIALKTAGIWDDLDFFYCFCTDSPDINFSLINWKNAEGFHAYNIGSPVLVPGSGIHMADGNSLIDTAFSPSLGVKYTQNECGFGCFVSGPQVGDTLYDMGCSNSTDGITSGVVLNSRTATNTAIARVNGNTSASATSVTSSIGLYHCRRVSATGQKIFKSGVEIANDTTTASTARSNFSFFVGASNGSGSNDGNTKRKYSMAWAGASLTGKEAAFNTLWMDYYSKVVSEVRYRAIIDVAITKAYAQPSLGQQATQKQLIKDMAAQRIWDEMDIFYNFTTDAGLAFSRLNWKKPESFECVSVGNAPAFSANSGILFDGLGHYDTGWNPSTNADAFTQNDAGCIIHVVNTNQVASVYDFGCSANADGISSGIMFNSCQVGTGLMRINSNTNLSLISGRNEGVWHIRRSAVNSSTGAKNTTGYGTDAVISTLRPTANLYLGGTNGNGAVVGRSARKYAMFAAGSGQVGPGNAFHTLWSAYYNPVRAQQAYQAILTYATTAGYTPPSGETQTLQLNLIRSLMDNGIWDFLDVFYVFAMDGGSAGFAYINWKAPGTFQITATVPGVFTNKQGFAFNGTTQFLDTNWRPNNTQAFGTNDAAYGLYVVNNTLNTGYDCGCSPNADGITTSSSFNGRTTGDLTAMRVNSNTTVAIASTNSSGFWHLKRTGANDTQIFRNGTSFGVSTTNASVSRTALDMFIGSSDGNGTATGFSNRTIAMFWAGASMNGRESTFHTYWDAYWSALNALVPTVTFDIWDPATSTEPGSYSSLTDGTFIWQNPLGKGVRTSFHWWGGHYSIPTVGTRKVFDFYIRPRTPDYSGSTPPKYNYRAEFTENWSTGLPPGTREWLSWGNLFPVGGLKPRRAAIDLFQKHSGSGAGGPYPVNSPMYYLDLAYAGQEGALMNELCIVNVVKKFDSGSPPTISGRTKTGWVLQETKEYHFVIYEHTGYGAGGHLKVWAKNVTDGGVWTLLYDAHESTYWMEENDGGSRHGVKGDWKLGAYAHGITGITGVVADEALNGGTPGSYDVHFQVVKVHNKIMLVGDPNYNVDLFNAIKIS